MAETWRADPDNDCCILITTPEGEVRIHIDPRSEDGETPWEWELASTYRTAILAERERAQQADKAVELIRSHLTRRVSEPTEWNTYGNVSHGASISQQHPIADPCDLCAFLATLDTPEGGKT